MTVNYEADLLAKTAVELRKLGASLNIPGASKGKKADLVVAIAAKWEAERLEREATKSDGSVKGNTEDYFTKGAGAEVLKKTVELVSQDQGKPKPKSGTSRAGMKMNVTNGQNGIEKAEILKKALAPKFAVGITSEKGIVTLKAGSLAEDGAVVMWTARGAYQYGPSVIAQDGKIRKVRNVSELLKILG